jgi:hypothetical protein
VRKARAVTGTASPIPESPDLAERVMKYESTRSTQDFISDIDGRTRWPVLIVASVFIVFVVGFLTSQILF